MNWNPYTVKELISKLQAIDGWFLDGGHSLEILLGKRLREHGDIDIGVFSSNAKLFLKEITDLGYDVQIANNDMAFYDDSSFDERNYNYWVSDESGYRFQVLVYVLNSGLVSFRRNPDITWPEDGFLISKENIEVVNPLVTYAFKLTASTVQEKDIFDISMLLKWVAENA